MEYSQNLKLIQLKKIGLCDELLLNKLFDDDQFNHARCATIQLTLFMPWSAHLKHRAFPQNTNIFGFFFFFSFLSVAHTLLMFMFVGA